MNEEIEHASMVLEWIRRNVPKFDEALTKSDQVEIPIQVNGKLRARLIVRTDIDDESLKKLALTDERIRAILEGKQIKKVIVVPKKLVNIVV